MKRAQVLESIGLGGLLVLGLFVARTDAGPYVTHRTSEPARASEPIGLPSCSSIPLREFSSGPGRADSLDLDFEPGIGSSLEPALPPPTAGASASPPSGPRPGYEPGELTAAAPVAQKQTVPEPASIVLVVTGLIGLAARRHLLRNRL